MKIGENYLFGLEQAEAGRLKDKYQELGFRILTGKPTSRFDLVVQKEGKTIVFEFISRKSKRNADQILSLKNLALQEFPECEFRLVYISEPLKKSIILISFNNFLIKHGPKLLLPMIRQDISNENIVIADIEEIDIVSFEELELSRKIEGVANCNVTYEIKNDEFEGRIKDVIPFKFVYSEKDFKMRKFIISSGIINRATEYNSSHLEISLLTSD